MKTVLLKVSGELFTNKNGNYNTAVIESLIERFGELRKSHTVGLVIGGGNFFRGAQHGKLLGLKQPTADMVGMLGTVMNGLILQDLLQAAGIETTLLSAVPIPQAVHTIKQISIEDALKKKHCLIFAGGTGNPYFSTDTNAVLRALQMGALEVWKATTVDYVYDDDPAKNPQAKPFKTISYSEVLQQHLKVMDATAILLAQQHKVVLRVFNLFTPSSLLKVAQDPSFGSTIS